MQKNTAGQTFIVFAFNRTTNVPVTGDAANITANIRLDSGAAAATNDVNPTETEDGFYEFTATQDETNANAIQLFPASSTADVQVIQVGGIIYTTPATFADLAITSGLVSSDAKSWNGISLATINPLPNAAANAAGGMVVSIAGGLNIDTILDASISSRNATTPPTTAAIRAEIDSNSSQLAALISRLTATRAGYLDKLNITGSVAASGEVTAIQNNTRVRLIVPQIMERPDSGNTVYKLHVWIYDEAGNMEAPDSLPTLTAVNQSDVNRSPNLGVVTLESTGHYSVTYTLASNDSIEQLIFEWSIVEGGVTRVHGVNTQVVDTTAVDFTSADRAKLDTLHDSRLTAGRAANLDNLNTGVPLSAAAIDLFFEELTVGHTTAGTFGQLLNDMLQDTGTDIPTSIAVIAGYLDTEIATLIASTGTTIPNLISLNNGLSAAIKAKTDQINFTVAGEVNSNVKSINDRTITGDGSATPFDV